MTGTWEGIWNSTKGKGQGLIALEIIQSGKDLTGTVNLTNSFITGEQSIIGTITNPDGPGTLEIGLIVSNSAIVTYTGSYDYKDDRKL